MLRNVDSLIQVKCNYPDVTFAVIWAGIMEVLFSQQIQPVSESLVFGDASGTQMNGLLSAEANLWFSLVPISMNLLLWM